MLQQRIAINHCAWLIQNCLTNTKTCWHRVLNQADWRLPEKACVGAHIASRSSTSVPVHKIQPNPQVWNVSDELQCKFCALKHVQLQLSVERPTWNLRFASEVCADNGSFCVSDMVRIVLNFGCGFQKTGQFPLGCTHVFQITEALCSPSLEFNRVLVKCWKMADSILIKSS